MTADVEVEAWRAAVQSHGGREMIDVRLWVWNIDGVWRPSRYGVSIAFHELMAALETAVGPQRLYGDDPAAGFRAACERAERVRRHLQRRGKRATPAAVARLLERRR